ncbi:hypothetical protein Agub_g5402 [Astrephomene gubernaculifera]|uniref:PLAT domain-containing protein n=1 Tax=Astrephomene gubernaculifera TaxID=47775 RepID=A0AAD3DLU1_9CHLO|nr:hypothetical protein Agub_g5402 [Astrephomene gubernaculifera]
MATSPRRTGQQPPATATGSRAWRSQWKWHRAWLAKHAACRREHAAGGIQVSGGAGGVSAAQQQAAAAVPDAVDQPNRLECRMWPRVEAEEVPFIRAVVARETEQLLVSGLAPLELQPGTGDAAGLASGPLPSLAAPVTMPPGLPAQPTPLALAAAAGGELGKTTMPPAAAPRSPPIGPAPAAAAVSLAASRPLGEALEALESEGDPAALQPRPAAAPAAAAAAPQQSAGTPAVAVVAVAAGAATPGSVGAWGDHGAPRLGEAESAVSPGVHMSPLQAAAAAGADAAAVAPSLPLHHHTTAPVVGAAPLIASSPLPSGSTTPSAVPLPGASAGAHAAEVPVAGLDSSAHAAAGAAPPPPPPPAEQQPAAVTVVAAGEAAAGTGTAARPPAAAAAAAAAAEAAGGLPSDEGPAAGGQPAAEEAAAAVDTRSPLIESAPQLCKVPPLLSSVRILSYEVVLAAGAQLGNFDCINVRHDTQSEAVYLEKVEVHCATSEPPLVWEVTVRRWMQPGEVLAGLRADPCVWEEWDMQVDTETGVPSAVLYFNPNLQEYAWKAPPPAPFPSLPGALPHVQQVGAEGGARQQQAAAAGRDSCWPHPLPPLCGQRSGLRYLDTIREPGLFWTTNVRKHYGLGFGGDLGVPPGQQVRIRGQTCSHSIAVQARGGFKWVDPDDPKAPRLLLPSSPAGAGAGNSAAAPGGGNSSAPAAAVAAAASAIPAENGVTTAATGVGGAGGVVPGVRECVVLSYNLAPAARELGEQYMWFLAHVALDDSAGTPPAPVRFSLVKDETLVWAAWVKAAGEVVVCCEQLVGCRQLQLVVESDFSGGARCVWLDPCLLCAPLQDRALVAELEAAAPQNKTSDSAVREGKVRFMQEADGDVRYMAPAHCIPQEVRTWLQAEPISRKVARTSGTAKYRISVFTGAEKNGGTHGRVYVRLHGRSGREGAAAGEIKSNLVCINPDGAVLAEGSKFSLLEPLTLPLMAEVESISLHHVPPPGGLLGAAAGAAVGGTRDWNVQHVEISCEETGRTWYFVAGGWFMALATRQAEAHAEQNGQLKPSKLQPADAELRLQRVVSETEFKVVLHVLSSGKGVGMGIEEDIQMVVLGLTEDGYRQAPFTLPGKSVDHSHETRLLSSPHPLGELLSVELSCRQKGLLQARLQCVEHHHQIPPMVMLRPPPHQTLLLLLLLRVSYCGWRHSPTSA